MRPLRFAAGFSAVTIMVMGAAATRAQDHYPSKIVRIVTAAPGSNNDWGARLVAQGLSPRLGQQVIVENRGSIGVGLVEFLREEGVETVSGDTLVHLEERGGYVQARTYNGNELTTQLVLVDNGGEPLSDLADAAGLDTDDGIVVNEYGQCSKPHAWAAGAPLMHILAASAVTPRYGT